VLSESFLPPYGSRATDDAQLGRRATDWNKVVDSIVYSADTLCNTMIAHIKQIVNSEFTGVNGPSKDFRGQYPSNCRGQCPTF
jgi:hypothetical protein